MIELGKKYRTRDGREVRIYAVYDKLAYGVHGAVNDGGNWRAQAWHCNGQADAGEEQLDLIEIRPRAIDRIIEWLDDVVVSCPPEHPIVNAPLALRIAKEFRDEEDAGK